MTAPNSHIFELLVQPFKSGLVVVACSASSIFFFLGGGGGGGGLAVKMTFGLVHADPLHPKVSIYKDMGIVWMVHYLKAARPVGKVSLKKEWNYKHKKVMN